MEVNVWMSVLEMAFAASILAAVYSLTVSLFIIYKSRSVESIIWALFFVMIFIWTLGEAFERYAGHNLEMALRYHKLVMVSGALIPPLFLHFSLVFPKKRKVAQSPYWGLIYAPNLAILTVALLTGTDYTIPVMSRWGFYINLTKAIDGVFLYNLSMIVIFLYIIGGIVVLTLSYHEIRLRTIRKHVLYTLIGAYILLVGGAVTNIVPQILGYEYFPWATINAMAMASIIAYAINEHSMLTIKIYREEIEPLLVWEYVVRPGYTYMMADEKMAVNLLKQAISRGYSGLCVVRNAQEFKNKYGLEKTAVVDTTMLASNTDDQIASVVKTAENSPIALYIDVEALIEIMKKGDKVRFIEQVLWSMQMLENYNSIILVHSKRSPRSILHSKNMLPYIDEFNPMYFEIIANSLMTYCLRNKAKGECSGSIKHSLMLLAKYEPAYALVECKDGVLTMEKEKISKYTLNRMLRALIRHVCGDVITPEAKRIIARNLYPVCEVVVQEGRVYSIEDDIDVRRTYALARMFADYGRRTLIITRKDPEEIRDRVLTDEVYWLTTGKVDYGKALKPRLETIRDIVFQCIQEEDSLIVLDCIEYLIINCGFESTLKMLWQIKDKIVNTNNIAIIPLVEGALQQNQAKILLREFKPLDVNVIVEDNYKEKDLRRVVIS